MCYHEAIYNKQELSGYRNVGTADCGYVLCPDWVESIGQHKLVVIHRDYREVAQSVKDIDLEDTIDYLPKLAEQLRKLDGLHINFKDIDERLWEIHDYLDLPYDKERAELFIGMNIQSREWRK